VIAMAGQRLDELTADILVVLDQQDPRTVHRPDARRGSCVTAFEANLHMPGISSVALEMLSHPDATGVLPLPGRTAPGTQGPQRAQRG
jgi:hypothetical protein